MEDRLGDLQEPTDDAKFDPVAYLNAKFPDEQSLSELDSFTIGLKREIKKTTDDLRNAVREQAVARKGGHDDLELAKQAIKELVTKISDIQHRAQDCEHLVQSVCSDIKVLDNAKRNISTTIATLKNLHMLTNGVSRLAALADSLQYKECAESLVVVSQLLETFKHYDDVPRLQALRATVSRTRKTLHDAVFADFRSVQNSADISEMEAKLRDACTVIDALGEDTRTEFVSWFADLQLAPSKSLFRVGTEGGSLYSVDRRHSWLKRVLRDTETDYTNVLPASWKMSAEIAERFCQDTSKQIGAILNSTPEGDLDVGLLLRAVERSARFEHELQRRFGTKRGKAGGADGSVMSTTTMSRDDGSEDDGGSMRTASTGQRQSRASEKRAEGDKRPESQVRQKWKSFFDRRSKTEAELNEASHLTEPNKPIEGEAATIVGYADMQSAIPEKEFDFSGQLVLVFEPVMGVYVDAEDASLSDLIMKCAREEKDLTQFLAVVSARASLMMQPQRGSTEELPGTGGEEKSVGAVTTKVLPSSTDFFLYIKKSLRRCAGLSRGAPLYDLYKRVFLKHLEGYAHYLMSRLPKVPEAGGFTLKHTEREDSLVCAVMNTAHYCVGTVSPLGQFVKNLVAEEFRDKIDMSDIETAFQNVIDRCIRILVQSCLSRVDVCFKSMSKQDWYGCSTVGDTSAYVSDLTHTMRDFFAILTAWLSEVHIRFFLDKFVVAMLPRVVDSIFSCKKISNVGAQQILLDFQAIRTMLLGLPGYFGATSSSAFPRMVNSNMARAELIIKVLMAKPAPEALVATYRALIPKGNSSQLQQLAELMGLKKTEQAEAVDVFCDQTGVQRDEPADPVGAFDFGPMPKRASVPRAAAEAQEAPPAASGKEAPPRDGGRRDMSASENPAAAAPRASSESGSADGAPAASEHAVSEGGAKPGSESTGQNLKRLLKRKTNTFRFSKRIDK